MLGTRKTTLLIFIFKLCLFFVSNFFTSFSFLEYNSVTIRNNLMILGRIIEQGNMECCIQE